MEYFIGAKLRIMTREQSLRKLQELLHPQEIKKQLYNFSETEGYTPNDALLTVYTIQFWPLT